MESYINEVPRDTFNIIEQIGSGSFSDIFSAIHIPTNTKVALKISIKNKNEEDTKTLMQESQINKLLCHPFICQFFSEIETEHLFIFVIELIEGISAISYVNQTNGLALSEAKNLFAQLLIAMEYLHNEAHITHRDLKLENIMIDSFGHIRLIDFGFSSVNTMMSTCCGSIPYCAPEILMGQKYTNAADIWSMGIILYAFIDGNLPFYHSNMNSLAVIICQHEVSFSNTFTKEARDLLRKMLVKDPDDRITIDEIKLHPFISDQEIFRFNYKEIFQLFQYKEKDQINLAPNRSSQIYSPYNYNQLLIDNSIELNSDSLSKTKWVPLKSSSRKVTQSQNCVGNDIQLVNDLISSRNHFPSFLNRVIQSAISNSNNQQKVTPQKNPINSLHLPHPNIRSPGLRRNPHRSVFKNSVTLVRPKIKNANNVLNDI